MSDNTEAMRFTMFHHLADMKIQRKHPRLLAQFENALEEYLEALRQDHAALVEALQSNVVLYQDAYENQKTLTRNALVYNREHYDELYQLRNQVKELEYNGELEHEKLRDATAKLASQAQTIIALHRVIKAQQNACRRLQRLLMTCVKERQQDRMQSHREIMQAEAIADDRWEQLEQKQQLIVSQRKRIELLESELLLSKKPERIPIFWRFFSCNKYQAKPLPKKTI